MSIRGMKKWALLLTFWFALQIRSLRADQTITGNLTVTGDVTTQGNRSNLGVESSSVGTYMLFTSGTTSTLEFDATSSANVWKWQQNLSGTGKVQMTLDNNNKLIIYDQSATPVAKITLDPLGTTSTFANSLTVTGSLTVSSTGTFASALTVTGSLIANGTGTFGSTVTVAGNLTANGTNNLMPNQTLTGTNSVLTEKLGDARYLSLSASSLHLFGGTATGTNSVALGDLAHATNTDSIALGHDASATGIFSVAIGEWPVATGGSSIAMGGFVTTASGAYSTAMGESTTASGAYSTAMGGSTTASGRYSTAMGIATSASGSYSTAMGYNTQAQAYCAVTLGRYNVGGFASGGNTSWITTDSLLELGNGTDATHRSDALVVYKNGNATFQGTVTGTGGFMVTGTAGFLTTAASVSTTDIPMFGH